MCKILLFITDIQKEQNKKPLIISGHSYKPKLFFFLITLPAKIFRAKSHKNNKTKFVWNNALTLQDDLAILYKHLKIIQFFSFFFFFLICASFHKTNKDVAKKKKCPIFHTMYVMHFFVPGFYCFPFTACDKSQLYSWIPVGLSSIIINHPSVAFTYVLCSQAIIIRMPRKTLLCSFCNTCYKQNLPSIFQRSYFYFIDLVK